jgi:hypothetical protein
MSIVKAEGGPDVVANADAAGEVFVTGALLQRGPLLHRVSVGGEILVTLAQLLSYTMTTFFPFFPLTLLIVQ